MLEHLVPPWEFVVVQPNEFEVVQQAEEESGHYFVMFTASWCGPCQNWKNNGNPDKMRQAGYPIAIVDIDKNPEYKTARDKLPAVVRFPTFWKVDRKTKQPIQVWVGTVSVDTLLSSSSAVTDAKSVEKPKYNIYNGRPGNSHQSRSSLINHLLNEGIHRGNHTLSDLNKMSDIELDNLHNLDHTISSH